MKRPSNLALWLVVSIQVLCAIGFVASLAMSIFGAPRAAASWQMREALEIIASLGLVIGSVLGVLSVIRAQRSQSQAEQALRAAAGAFAKVVDEKFDAWSLTNAERDVAWLAIKGFSTKETAEFRGTSEGTIKSQCNAVYRKVGVSGRTQLISLMVEDLLLDAPGAAE